MSYADRINELSEGPESAFTRDFDLGFRGARAAARRIAAEADAEIASAKERIDALEAENASLRKIRKGVSEYARRYAFIRDQHWNEARLCVVVNPKESVRLGHDCPSGERLDAEIDAALTQNQKEEKR